MKIRNLKCLVVFLVVCSASGVMAAEKLEACLTVGSSNAGTLLGIRVRQAGADKLIATVEKVRVFHHMIYEFEKSSLLVVEVQKRNLFGTTVDYVGDGFRLILDSSSAEPYFGTGFFESTIDAQKVSSSVYNAQSSNYCQ